MITLDANEQKALLDFFGQANYYELAAVLCKTYQGDKAIQEVVTTLNHLYYRIALEEKTPT